MAELIRIMCGTCGGPKNHVLGIGSDPTTERGSLGDISWPTVKCREYLAKLFGE